MKQIIIVANIFQMKSPGIAIWKANAINPILPYYYIHWSWIQENVRPRDESVTKRDWCLLCEIFRGDGELFGTEKRDEGYMWKLYNSSLRDVYVYVCVWVSVYVCAIRGANATIIAFACHLLFNIFRKTRTTTNNQLDGNSTIYIPFSSRKSLWGEYHVW